MSQFKGSPYKKYVIECTASKTEHTFTCYSRVINQRCNKCLNRFKTALFNETKAREVCIDCLINNRVSNEEFIDLIEGELGDE